MNLKPLAHFIVVDLNRSRKKENDTKSARLETLKALLITGKIYSDSSWEGWTFCFKSCGGKTIKIFYGQWWIEDWKEGKECICRCVYDNPNLITSEAIRLI